MELGYIPYPIYYFASGSGNITPKELGIFIIILALWFIGLIYAIKISDDKFDNPLIGLVAYVLATGIVLIFI